LALSGLLSAATVIVLAIAALAFAATNPQPELVSMAWALAGVMPFVLSREFGRRFAFARLQMAQAIIIDVAVAAIQLTALGWLAWTGRMSAVTACFALGGACGLTTIVWLYLARADFSLHVGQVRKAMKQSWNLGKWLLVGQVTVQIQTYITYWLCAVISGAATTGVYAACMNIVGFANPLIFGLGNILTPRSVLAWKEGGGEGLRRQAALDAMLLFAVMAVFCGAVMVAGEDVIRILYHGKEFEGQGYTVTVLALAMLATAVGMPASNALASMERPRAIVVVGALGAAVTVVLVWWLMIEWGLFGAACGFLAGNVVGAAGRWVAFLALVPRANDQKQVIPVLEKLTGSRDDGTWTVSRRGEGDHAIAYAVQASSGKPVWQNHNCLIVKLYKSEAALDGEMVDAQLQSLNRVHAAVNGRTASGWTIAAPQPVGVSGSPLAVAMTVAPGKDIDSYPASGDSLTPEILQSAGQAFAVAMAESWSRGQIHGDLGPRNILFDVPAKVVSLIDPGTWESCAVCNGEDNGLRPATLDLGHLLSDLGTDVTDITGNQVARMRKQLFIETTLRSFIATVGSNEEKRRLLDQIQASVRAHLAATLKPSGSLRGLWHRFVMRTAMQRIGAILGQLKTELGYR
jgi:O-antigen/teichoic acid export membrane protein